MVAIGLLFLVGFQRKLAFRAAHGLTLASAALGGLTLRSAPVGATIARQTSACRQSTWPLP